MNSMKRAVERRIWMKSIMESKEFIQWILEYIKESNRVKQIAQESTN